MRRRLAPGGQDALSRFENSVGPGELPAMARVRVDSFVSRHAPHTPGRNILDLDATDDPTYGQQQLAQYRGLDDERLDLPPIVAAQVDDGPRELVVALLRRGRSHAGGSAVASPGGT